MVENYKDWEYLKHIPCTEEVKPGDKLVWITGDGFFFKNGDIVTVKELYNKNVIYNFEEPDRGTMWYKTCFARFPVRKSSNTVDNKTITLDYSSTTAHPLIHKEDLNNSYTKIEPYKPKKNSKLRVDVFGGFYD